MAEIPIYIVIISVAIATFAWKIISAEQELRKELLRLFGESFVYAYYIQYAFLREILHHSDAMGDLDNYIDEFVLQEVNCYNKKIKLDRSKLVTEYAKYRADIDQSRFNSGLMLSILRITLGDESFADEYREYVKQSRKISFHIRRIMKDGVDINKELPQTILSLKASDLIKLNFERKLSFYSIHRRVLRKFLKSGLMRLPFRSLQLKKVVHAVFCASCGEPNELSLEKGKHLKICILETWPCTSCKKLGMKFFPPNSPSILPPISPHSIYSTPLFSNSNLNIL